ncbi:MAG: U32 family peptidase, partial [Clostridia bacterium]|nr:U32 family peptidase [Clostridia bacterium]
MELLAPAGEFDSLVMAVQNGANAVYVGGTMFSARKNAVNFDFPELTRAVDYCHLRGVKLYLAVNTLVKEFELSDLCNYLEEIYRIGVDAVIVQDFGVLSLVRRCLPELSVNASTQMTVNTAEGVRELETLGVSRVVLARELSKEDISSIRSKTTAELEVFVHGALCMSYSGQCLMSSMLGGRSGNRGACAQPCRLPYTLL